MMSRPVAGLACRIRIPVRQYQAVAVLVRETRNVVRIVHRDAALSVDVEEFAAFETAEEYRDRLATFLDLPPLTLAGAPASAEDADDEAEAAPVASPSRRRNSAHRSRRPRFLTRRRAGEVVKLRKIEGREIIARH
jgi:hypothetical protein